MKSKIEMAARLLLGLMFTVFGANGLVMAITGTGFMPMPPPSPEMLVVFTGLMGAKYLMPLVALFQFVSGVLFLSNKFVNLGICLLTPIVVNILGIHLFVDLAGLPMAIVVVVLLSIVIKSRWEYFHPVLCKK